MKVRARRGGRLGAMVILAALGLLVGAHEAPAQTPSGPTAAQVVAAVELLYRQATTAQADFKTSYSGGSPNARGCTEGHVVYTRSRGTVWTCSDGSQLANQTCAELPTFGCFGQLTALLSFRLVDTSGMKLQGGYVLAGTPKVPSPTYPKVLFYVDAATARVKRALFIDAYGNRNRVDFANPTIGP